MEVVIQMKKWIKWLLSAGLLLGLLSGCTEVPTEDFSDGIAIEEDGWYSSKDEVAAYLQEYHHLPDNYLTKNEAYNYFEVDANSINREEELEKNINYYKKYGKKIATGNGYVDILLLMSVIVTTLSVTAIIVFSVI